MYHEAGHRGPLDPINIGSRTTNKLSNWPNGLGPKGNESDLFSSLRHGLMVHVGPRRLAPRPYLSLDSREIIESVVLKMLCCNLLFFS
jgi:hypothetical protein